MVNLESIRLYRDILRVSKKFFWKNEKGEVWADILKKNARKEFEEARNERDPLIIVRLLFVGRDCLDQSKLKWESAAAAMRDNIEKTKNK